MVRLQSLYLGNKEYTFITITPRSTMTRSAKTCLGSIYGSNRTVQSFTREHYLNWIELFVLNSNSFLNPLIADKQMIDIKKNY